MSDGIFIAFEGGEGSGKSTQARILADRLERDGLSVLLTREPGGTQGAEAIRSLLLQPPGAGWGARAEALLFAAARSDHVEKVIRPALARGACVICDRFLDSSRAYQGGGGRVEDSSVVQLHAFGSRDLRPDVTIVLDAPPDIAEQRLRERDNDERDAIEARGREYHERVRQAFRRFAEEDRNTHVIDAMGPRDDVAHRIWDVVTPYLSNNSP